MGAAGPWGRLGRTTSRGALPLAMLLGAPAYATSYTWNVDANGNWNQSSNWTPSGFPNGTSDSALFGSKITADRTVTLGQNIVVGVVEFNDNNNYTISGTDTLRFDGPSGAQLNVYQSGASGHRIASLVTLIDPLSTYVQGGALITLSGAVSGAGSLQKSGDGTLVLAGANVYTGYTYINGGTLRAEHSSALGGTGSGTTVSAGAGASLELAGGIAIGVESLTLHGTGFAASGALRNASGNNSYTGQITLGAAAEIQSDSGTLTLTGNVINGAGYGLTFDGAGTTVLQSAIASSATAVTKTGTGTLRVTSLQAYTGATTVGAGTLELRHASGLGTTAAGTAVTSGGTLDLAGNLTVSGEALSLAGAGAGGNGALRNSSGDNTWTGGVTLTGSAEVQSDAGTLRINGNVDGYGYGLTADGAGKTVINGAIGIGPGIVQKNGTGELWYEGANPNSYFGMTWVNNGKLFLNKPAGTVSIAGDVTVGTGASLILCADNLISNDADMTLAGGSFLTSGKDDTINSLTLTGNSVIDFGNGDSIVKFLSVGTWTAGKTLEVQNWSGDYLVGNGTDQFRFDVLLNSQYLSQIKFLNPVGLPAGIYDATILSSGCCTCEVVPVVPEPATWFSLAGLAACLGWRERRRLKAWHNAGRSDERPIV